MPLMSLCFLGCDDYVARAIARGCEDLAHGRVRPWTQAKADADRIRRERKIHKLPFLATHSFSDSRPS